MNKKIHLYILCFLIIPFSPLFTSSQTVTVSSDTACIGDTILVPVMVTNFDSIAAISINFSYDTAVIEFDTITNIHDSLQGIISNTVISTVPEIKIGWYSSTSSSANIGSAKLFDLKIIYKGGNSALNFLTTCEITDNNYNLLTVSYTNGVISQKITPVVSSHPTSKTICLNSGTYFSITATNALTYQWQFSNNAGLSWSDLSNNAIYSGVYDDTLLILSAPLNIDATYYRCVTANECIANSNAALLSLSNPIAFAGTDDTICYGNSANLSGNVSGGYNPFNYTWSTTQNIQNITVSPLASTSYYLTVTDFLNCSSIDTINVLVSNPLVNAGTDDTICIGFSSQLSSTPSGGFTPYIYSWSTYQTTQQITVSPTITSIYSVSVTDLAGCTASDGVSVMVSNPIADAGTDDTICIGSSTIISGIVSGGIPGYTYSWSSGGNTPADTVNPSVTSVYNFTVTDSKGCITSDSVIVFVSNPIVDAGPNDTICLGDFSTISPSVLGGYPAYNYLWNTYATNSSISVYPIQNTTYYITITDSKGCNSNDSVLILVSDPVINTSNDDTICFGVVANLSATTSGGFASYSYSWSNSGNTANIQVSPAATTTYTVTTSDIVGCTDTGNVTITVSNPVANAGPDDSICIGSFSNLQVGTSGGFSPYSYLWNTNDTVVSISVSPAINTSYIVTITDSIGCNHTDTVIVLVSDPVAYTGPDDSICMGLFANITGNGSGGFTPYSYSWSTSASTQSISVSPSLSTIYSLTITDLIGCFSSDSILITVYDNPITMAGSGDTTCAGDTVILNGSASGGTPPYSFLWSNGSNNAITNVSPIFTTTYLLTTTDTIGCFSSDSVVISVNPLPVINIGNDTIICASHVLSLTAGSGFESYFWSTGDTIQQIDIDSSGVGIGTIKITVIITDANGCQNTDTIYITFDDCAGIGNLNVYNDFTIIPNPTSGKIVISIPGINSPLQLNIFNINGTLLKTLEMRSLNNKGIYETIDISYLPKGIYMFRLINTNGTVTKRVVLY